MRGRPIKLLMLSHYFAAHRGGIEIVAAELMRALAAHDFHIVWLAAGSSADKSESGNCCQQPIAASNVTEQFLKFPYPILFPSAWRAIVEEVQRADVVLAHDALYMTSIVAYLATRLLHKPYVIVQHIGVVPYRNFLLRHLMQIANGCIARPVLRRVDQVIFISELTQKYFGNLRSKRSPQLVFNGVDTMVFSPPADAAERNEIRRRLALPTDKPIGLFVGRFTEKKGLPALEHLARIRSDICFAFAGWGALDPTVWGLTNVRIYKDLSGTALADLYRASDCLLLPSVGEGFPLVIQEALACGLPVICGTDTARADSRASVLLSAIQVDPDDSERTARLFSTEMSRLLAHETAQDGRLKRSEFARTYYSWASSAEEYARILWELCCNTGSSPETG